MRKQKVVRTFPSGWTVTTDNLEKYLDKGWFVVSSNIFIIHKEGVQGIEYILEKDE